MVILIIIMIEINNLIISFGLICYLISNLIFPILANNIGPSSLERERIGALILELETLFSIGIGIGSPIGIASSPTEECTIKFTIKKMGTVTSSFHNSDIGDTIGVRGPLGNGWPMEELKGKNIVVIGGGFAFSTLRSLVLYLLDDKHRKDYGKITVIYGNRNSGEVLYREVLDEWEKRDDIEIVLTIDSEEEDWTRKVGYVAAVVKEVAPSSDNAVAIICGPPIMIKTAQNELEKLNWKDEQILNSLEMRMKCGIGKCGRCNIGDKFVCIDGPVFSLAELKRMPKEH